MDRERFIAEGSYPPEDALDEMEPPQHETAHEPPLYSITTKGLTVHAETLALEPETKDARASIWFLSAVGSQTACKGVAANLLKSNPEAAVLQPNQAARDRGFRTHYQVMRAANATEKWSYKVAKLPRTGTWQLLLYNLSSLYDNSALPFILVEPETRADNDDALARLHRQYLSRKLSIPLHHAWANWLWQRSLKTRETKALAGIGRRAFFCQPQEASIAKEISLALTRKRLYTPEPLPCPV